RGLQRGGLRLGLVDDLAGLHPGRRQDPLGLTLGLVAVLVGLLLGEPQDLLDAGTQPGQGRLAGLLQLLGGVAQLLLHGAEPLLGGAEPPLHLGEPLLRLGAVGLRLGDLLVEAGDEVVDLLGVVAAELDRELRPVVGVLEEREGRLLLGHWDILADDQGWRASAGVGIPRRCPVTGDRPGTDVSTPGHPAGWTSSTRTPPASFGWTKLMRDPAVPRRGVS